MVQKFVTALLLPMVVVAGDGSSQESPMTAILPFSAGDEGYQVLETWNTVEGVYAKD